MQANKWVKNMQGDKLKASVSSAQIKTARFGIVSSLPCAGGGHVSMASSTGQLARKNNTASMPLIGPDTCYEVAGA
eukprot:6300659-Amphidinium_carterae.1